MADQSFTVTNDDMTNHNDSFNARAAGGIVFVTGSFGIGAVSGTASDGGSALDLTGYLATVYYCMIVPNNTSSDIFAQYNYAKAAVDVFWTSDTTTGRMLAASGTQSITGVGGYFAAIGPPA